MLYASMKTWQWITFGVLAAAILAGSIYYSKHAPTPRKPPVAPRPQDENKVVATVGTQQLRVKDVRRMDAVRSLSTGAPVAMGESVREGAERLAMSLAAEKAGLTPSPEAVRAAVMQRKVMIGVLGAQLSRAQAAMPSAMPPSPAGGRAMGMPNVPGVPMPGLPPQPGLPGVPNPLAQRNVPGMPTAPGVPGMPGLPGMGRSLGNSPDEPDHSADPLSRAQNLLRRQGLTEDDLVEEVKTDLRVKAYLGKVGGIDAGQNLMETRKEAVRQAVLEFPIRLEK